MALDNDVSTQFAESDSEEESKRTLKKPTAATSDQIENTQYKKSLLFKGAKGNNSGIYYVNYLTAKGGDGLDRDVKNQLASDNANADANCVALQVSLTNTLSLTKKIQTEPFNSEMNGILEKAENESLELLGQLDMARAFQCNAKHKENTIKRINYFSSFWRKRRKTCMDFLISMEEITEGTITAKSCLRGTGPIDIDSDDAIIKLAKDFATKKSNRTLTSKGEGQKSKCKPDANNPGLLASDNFVAVSLDSQGNVKRIQLRDENDSM